MGAGTGVWALDPDGLPLRDGPRRLRCIKQGVRFIPSKDHLLLLPLEFRLHRTTRRLIAGLVTLATIAILWMWLGSDPSGQAPRPPSPDAQAPPPWSGRDTDATRQITWEIPEEGPPVRHVGRPSSESTSVPLDLTVEPSERPLAWSGMRQGTAIWLVGETTVAGRDLTIRVVMSDGNPQARLSVRWDAPPLNERTDPVYVQWHGPQETTTFLNHELDIGRVADAAPDSVSPWRPTWIRRKNRGTTTTLRGWTGDGYTVASSGAGLETVNLRLWDPRQHLGAESCRTVAGPDQGDAIVASADLIFGRSTPVVAAPLSRGTRATLSPIFDVPTAHPDATLHAGDAERPEDWVRRARTLLYGHSSTDDPRFGNGGLLGHDLGGSLVVPTRFAESPAVRTLIDSVENRAVDFAVRQPDSSEGNASAELEGYSTRFASTTDCKPPAETAPTTRISEQSSNSHGATDLLSDGAARLGSPAHLKPGFLVPNRLDGRRTSFVDQTILRGRVEQLVEQGGVAAFTTPLLGSRNPLTPTAKEALLQPERWGEWTIDPDVSSALADLSHWTDVHRLSVTAPATWIEYWTRARNTTIRWSADGALHVTGADVEAVADFTLMFPGSPELSLSVDGDAPEGRLHRTGTGTRVWWDLAEHRTHRISAAEGQDFSSPHPVEWALRD